MHHVEGDAHMETYAAERASEDGGPVMHRWLKWLAAAEKVLGVETMDGDQSVDGYSLDYAGDAFNEGKSPQEYANDIICQLPAFWTVAIFTCNRAYGGPEEGGWWYDYGYPVDHIPEGINPNDLLTVFPRLNGYEAHEWAKTLQQKLDAELNKGRGADLGSVLCSGRYVAKVCRGYPVAFPETRPHYE